MRLRLDEGFCKLTELAHQCHKFYYTGNLERALVVLDWVELYVKQLNKEVEKDLKEGK